MVEQDTRKRRLRLRALPLRGRKNSRPPAKLAHEVAHAHKTRKPFRATARRIGGYRLKRGTTAELEETRLAFLEVVQTECPDAFREWQELLPLMERLLETRRITYLNEKGLLRERSAKITGAEAGEVRESFSRAILAWADKYHLRTNWVIDVAAQSLETAAIYDWARPPRFRRRNSHYYAPGSNEQWRLELLPYAGEDPRSYMEYARDIFERAMQAHIEARIRLFDEDPQVERLSFMDNRALSALRSAALWQVQGQVDGGDTRTIHKVLRRLDLAPRPGLGRQ